MHATTMLCHTLCDNSLSITFFSISLLYPQPSQRLPASLFQSKRLVLSHVSLRLNSVLSKTQKPSYTSTMPSFGLAKERQLGHPAAVTVFPICPQVPVWTLEGHWRTISPPTVSSSAPASDDAHQRQLTKCWLVQLLSSLLFTDAITHRALALYSVRAHQHPISDLTIFSQIKVRALHWSDCLGCKWSLCPQFTAATWPSQPNISC